MTSFIQISDPHLGLPDEKIEGEIDTAAALTALIERIAALPVAPACVVASGDLVNGGSEAEYRHLDRLLAGVRVPVHLLPGNHDERAALSRVFGERLARAGRAIQFALDLGDWRVLGLDTLDAGRDSGWLCIDRLDWLHEQLSASPLPALIVLHHPPFECGVPGMDAIRLGNPDGLAAVLADHPQVLGVACGHVHRALFTQWAGRPAVSCPGVAHQVHFDPRPGAPLAWTREPGGMLLHEFAAGVWRTQVLSGPAPTPHAYVG